MLPIDTKTFADAYRLASRVTSLAIGCVVPPLLGYVADQKLAISPAGVLIGSMLGFLSLFLQLRQLVRDMAGDEHRKK